MIAGTLKGIISQRLVKTADGHGRIATAEIMVMTGRVHDMILDPEQTGHLPQVIREGEYYGMQTFDQHLLKHLQSGKVTYDEAMRVATSPHDFKLMVQADAKLRPLASSNGHSESLPAGTAPAAMPPSAPPASDPMHAVVADLAPSSAPPPGI
jgi:twitching motility protein PilT